ncbi:MAG TPA: glycosyltransferase family 2 protein [Alphaproteobacteria bacterium]|nr:glycosyltransferase family 2 protein [Alphaproteobacteria bacterium]
MSDTLAIAVCVLTFRRPEGLAKLLGALARQRHSAERPYRLTVVVIDNDPAGTAREPIASYPGTDAFDLVYVHEPQQGIPFARNCALRSVPEGTDLVCFIDDDEWPADAWLDAMLEVRALTGADCVYGPVEPVYPPNPPRWFVDARLFERRRHKDRARIGHAASNNVMIDLQFVRAQRLRFEERMRFTGGSDYLFFAQAVRKGLRIHWAERALVYDVVPLSRMTWKWVLQRQFRLGNTFAVSDLVAGGLGRRAYRLGYGIARCGLGIVMLPALAVSPYWGMRALTHLLRGAGAVSGVLGHAFEEYAPARLRDA